MITDGVEKHFVVDPVGFSNVVGEYDENGAELTHYSHGLGLLARDTVFYTFEAMGTPVSLPVTLVK